MNFLTKLFGFICSRKHTSFLRKQKVKKKNKQNLLWFFNWGAIWRNKCTSPCNCQEISKQERKLDKTENFISACFCFEIGGIHPQDSALGIKSFSLKPLTENPWKHTSFKSALPWCFLSSAPKTVFACNICIQNFSASSLPITNHCYFEAVLAKLEDYTGSLYY